VENRQEDRGSRRREVGRIERKKKQEGEDV
jgi:hypothetical protein